MMLDELKGRLGQEVAALKQEGRNLAPGILSGAQGPRIIIEGKTYINLAANNYLGLAQDHGPIKSPTRRRLLI